MKFPDLLDNLIIAHWGNAFWLASSASKTRPLLCRQRKISIWFDGILYELLGNVTMLILLTCRIHEHRWVSWNLGRLWISHMGWGIAINPGHYLRYLRCRANVDKRRKIRNPPDSNKIVSIARLVRPQAISFPRFPKGWRGMHLRLPASAEEKWRKLWSRR